LTQPAQFVAFPLRANRVVFQDTDELVDNLELVCPCA
jgi:hypothetical protein